jgi:hypothetical protein
VLLVPRRTREEREEYGHGLLYVEQTSESGGLVTSLVHEGYDVLMEGDRDVPNGWDRDCDLLVDATAAALLRRRDVVLPRSAKSTVPDPRESDADFEGGRGRRWRR